MTIRPVYKREVYLKRCIAVPGDKLAMRDELLYIDGRPQAWPPEAETYFHVFTGGHPLDEVGVKQQYGLDISNADEIRQLDNAGEYDMLLTWKAREKMLKDGFARRIVPEIDSSTEGVFPNDARHHWTRDNYGPIYVNGHEENSYTFKMNYYWVLGDNLHGSQDSRYWGFVPEDHLIGKVWMVR